MPVTLFVLIAPPLSLAIAPIVVGRSSLPVYTTVLAQAVFALYLNISELVYPLPFLVLNQHVREDWKIVMQISGGFVVNWFKSTLCKCCPRRQSTPITPAQETTKQTAPQDSTQETASQDTSQEPAV